MAEITSATAQSSSQLTSALSGGENALGKDEFLLLMVEQLKNQDPMNPSDATEFTAQLAQYSSLEQLFNINDSLETMGSTSDEVQRMSALSMIGKEVVTQGVDFNFSGAGIKLGYDLDASADNGSIYIRNASGSTVATLPFTDGAQGQHFFEWDGNDNSGNRVPDGQYSLGVSAFSADENVAVTSLISSEVVGVDLVDGGDVLVTHAGEFSLADIESVRSI
ncbi:MAG: flagellar hook assembly protein FlgD [Desulfuromonas sp.]|nr:flagellar hook assembly protein FlgD [Desulfuromonas sp.]